MTKRDDGGPAFPHDVTIKYPDTSARATHYHGMTLRDWFAGQALTALIQNRCYPFDSEVGKYAYAIADAMLAEREK